MSRPLIFSATLFASICFLLPSHLFGSNGSELFRSQKVRMVRNSLSFSDTAGLPENGLQDAEVLIVHSSDSTDSVAISHSEPKRGIAIALTVLLGPLGGHRLYLGTDPKVPVLYTITLGGGLGVLPLIDLVHLIVKGELSPYINNGKVFMWIREDED